MLLAARILTIMEDQSLSQSKLPIRQSKVDHLTRLPNELLEQILSYVTVPKDVSDAHKKVWTDVNLVCKALRNVAETFLFREVCLSLHTQDDAPSDQRPLSWTKPRLQMAMEQSPRLGPYIKHLKLRLAPFPSEDWTAERCRGVVKKVKPARGRKLGVRKVHALAGNMQTAVSYAYCRQLGDSFGWSPGHTKTWQGSSIVEDPTDLVAGILRQLPNLRHVELAAWQHKNSDQASNSNIDYHLVLHHLSVAFATDMLMKIVPDKVQSFKSVYRHEQRPPVVKHDMPGTYGLHG